MRQAATFTLALLFGAAGCSGGDATTPACVSMHPTGNTPVASADVLGQTVADCNADTGACTANPPCAPVQNRVCDAWKFMTGDAAICLAQAAGLTAGLQPPAAGLVYDAKARRVAWGVSNVLYDAAHPMQPDAGGGESGGQYFQIDAINGAVLGSYDWSESP